MGPTAKRPALRETHRLADSERRALKPRRRVASLWPEAGNPAARPILRLARAFVTGNGVLAGSALFLGAADGIGSSLRTFFQKLPASVPVEHG